MRKFAKRVSPFEPLSVMLKTFWLCIYHVIGLSLVNSHQQNEHFTSLYDAQSTVRIVTPSESLKATQFPFVVDMINLTGIKDYESSEDLSKLMIAVYNGTIQDMDTYPGLWIQSKSSSEAIVAGLENDIRSFLDDGMFAVNPPRRNWVGSSSIRLTFIDVQNNVSSAVLRLDFDPSIEFVLQISPDTIKIQEDETLLFSSHNITMSVQSEFAVKAIDCHVEVRHGLIQQDFFNGTVASVVHVFESIIYQPAENYNGIDIINLDCENNLGQMYNTSLAVDIHAVNDEPQIVIPKTILEIDEDIPFSLGAAGIYIVDSDAREQDGALIAVDLQMNIGEILLPAPSKLGGIRTMRESTSHLRLIGHLDRVNIAIQFLVIEFPTDWFGSDSLSIKCVDSVDFDMHTMELGFADGWVIDSVSFNIRSVNDAPQILVKHERFAGIKQGDNVRFDQGAIQIIDIDSQSDEIYLFRWVLREVDDTLPGSFVVSEDGVTTGGEVHNTTTTISTFEGSGKLSEIANMKHVQLGLNEDWFGEIRGLALQVIDSSGDSVTEQVAISVAKVSDRPGINVLKHNLTTREDEPIVLSKALELTHTSIRGTQVHHEQSVFKVSTKSQKGGLIRLNKIVEGSFLSKSMDTPQDELLIVGPLPVLNAALADSLTYTPPQNVDTFDLLSFSVFDNNGDLCDQVDLYVDIEEVNDAPIIETPTVLKSIADDRSQAINLRGLRIFDDGGHDQHLRIYFTVEPAGVGDLMLQADGISEIVKNTIRQEGLLDHGPYLIEGTLDHVNDVMYKMVISIKEDYAGKGSLLIEAIDAQGASSETKIAFKVDSIISIPRPTLLNSTLSVLEDEHIDMKDLFVLNGTDMSKEKKVEMTISTKVEPSDMFTASFLFHLSGAVSGAHFPHHDFSRGPAESFVVIGTLDCLNNAVDALRLVPPSGFSGEISVKVEIYDFPGIEIFTEDILVTVNAVDNAPIVSWNGIEFLKGNAFMELYEDTIMKLQGVGIIDVDNPNDPVSVTLAPKYGRLCYPEIFMDMMEPSSDQVSFINEHGENLYCFQDGTTMAFTNKITDANEIVGSVLYQPVLNWFGLDLLYIGVESQNKRVSSSFNIFVKATSDAPLVIVPNSTLTVEEGENLAIEGIAVKDDDIDLEIQESRDRCALSPHSCYITLEFETLNGIISLFDNNGVTSIVASGKRMIKGSLDRINSALNGGIIYEPNTFFNGIDYLQISATDFDGISSKPQLVQIHVKSKNHLPTISLPEHGSILHLVEDTLGVIGTEYCDQSSEHSPVVSCDSIQIAYNRDSATNKMKVSMSWQHGTFRLPRLRLSETALVTTTNSNSSDGFANEIRIEDKLDPLNWVLGSIQLKGDLNLNTMGKSLETLHISVEYDESKTSETLRMIIAPVNDPPVIEIESGLFYPDIGTGDVLSLKRVGIKPIVLKEETSIHLKGISIRDVDCKPDQELLELSMNSHYGYLHLPQQAFARQWIAGDRRVSQEIIVRSTVNEINQILKHVVYKPNEDFFGNDKIHIQVSDFGNPNSHDLPMSDLATIPVEILPAPDTPIVKGPTYLYMKEDATETVEVFILHPDQTANIYVSLECMNDGVLTLNSARGLNLTNTDGKVNGTGSASAWNRAFDQLTYTPPRNYNTDGSRILNEIRIEVSETIKNRDTDRSTHVIFVKIDGLPDPHVWQMTGSTVPIQSAVEISDTIELEEDKSIAFSISLFDEDAIRGIGVPEESYSVRISTSSGILQLNSYNGIFMKNGAPRSSLLHFDATFSSINNALDKLIYTPKPDFNGHDVITLFCSDRSYFNSTAKIPLVILPETDIPVIKTPMIIQCEEGTSCNLHGLLSLEDPDFNSKLVLQVKSESGVISFAEKFDLSSRSLRVSLLSGSSSGDKAFILEGSATDLNSILTNLIYLSQPNIAPTIDTISLSVHVDGIDKSRDLESTSKVQVIVTKRPGNSPFIRYDEIPYHDDDDDICPSSFHLANSSDKFCDGYVQVKPLVCTEDNHCPFGKFRLSGDHSAVFELQISVENGFLFFNRTMDGIQVSPDSSVGHSRVHVRGDMNHLNQALRFLTYLPEENFVGKDTVNLQLSAPLKYDQARSDNVFQLILHSLNVDVIVNGALDRIKLVGPRELLFVNEDEYTRISGISVNYVSNDNNYTAVEASIQSFNGKFRLGYSPFDAVSVIDATASSKSASFATTRQNDTLLWTDVLICGDVETVANILSSISFIGDLNFNSADEGDYASVSVGVRRVETCGINLPKLKDVLEDFISILIHVNSVNDLPEIMMDTLGNEHVCLDTEYEMCIAEDHEVNLPTEIVDFDSDIMLVNIRTNGFGKVSVSHGHGHFIDAYFIEGDGNGDYFDNIVLKGTVNAVNDYLYNLCIKGKTNYNGNDGILWVEARDQFGGDTSVQISIMTNPVQDSLVLWFVVDSRLAQPLVMFVQGETRILGRDWLAAGDSYMEAITPLENVRLLGPEQHQIRPLSGARIFTISNGDDSLLESKVCVKISVDHGYISIEHIEGIIFEESNHIGRKEIVYIGSIESVNDASETIMYQAVEDQSGNIAFHVEVTRETCGDFVAFDSNPRCLCDFEWPEASGGFNISVNE